MNQVKAAAATLAIALCFSAAAFGAASSMATASHSGGGVTVKATYHTPQPPNELRFEVQLDTHSVNLDGYDLQSLALLRDAGGKTYRPVNVEAKGSGHHRDAVVVFPQPPGGPQHVELVIKDIGGVNERILRFQIS